MSITPLSACTDGNNNCGLPWRLMTPRISRRFFCGLLIEFQTARNYLRYACIIYCVAALMCSGQDARERVLRHKQCAHSGIVQFWNACTIEDVGMAELTYSAHSLNLSWLMGIF